MRPDSVESAEMVDVGNLLRTLRRQWRAFLAFLTLGIVAAVLVVLFAPRRYQGRASVVARGGPGAGGSIVGRLGSGGVGDLLGNVTGLGGGRSDFETELQVLKSRELASRLVDSLRLQLTAREPRGVDPRRYVSAATFEGRFEPRTYMFERAADGRYRASAGDRSWELTPGQPSRLDDGTLTLSSAELPARFGLKVFDREDAITRTLKRFTVSKAGGDVVRIVYNADDSLTAADAPNALVRFYLARRRTTDRSVNARRVEYVTAQMDSTARELGVTERALRREQEASGVIDAEIVGETQWQAAATLRRSLTDLEVDAAAVNQLLAQADSGTLTRRQLVAYPSFFRGSSISPLVAQLSELDARRLQLLERRTERDPEVVALDQTIKSTEDQILSLARSYANSVNRQRAEMAARLDSLEAGLAALPAAQERGGRLQRDIVRLSSIYAALQAQLVEARLGVIGEGGEIKPLDVAAVPREPSFPNPILTLGLGTVGGLVTGAIAALMLGWFGRTLRDPDEVERISGIAAQRLLPDTPLFVLGSTNARSVLVVPLDAGVRTEAVAERLARTAMSRSIPATVMDLTGTVVSAGNGAGNGAGAPASPSAAIEALEREYGMVVVRLPALASEVTFAALRDSRPVVLVAPPLVNRARLSSALEMLRRMAVPCAGVVLGDGQPAPRIRALT